MPPLVVSCKTYDFPSPPPAIHLPMGVLQAPFAALDRIPTGRQMLAKLLQVMDVALMPVKQLLELIEIVMAFKNCFQALPDAIVQLSPQPIFDCLKNMLKAFARLLSYIPPITYVKTMRDVCRFFVLLIDEVVTLFQRIDGIIAGYLDVLNDAELRGDLELVQFANCSMQNLRISMSTLFKLLQLVKPVAEILLTSITRLLQNPLLNKEVVKLVGIQVLLGQASSALVAGTAIPAFGGGLAGGAQDPRIPLPKIAPVMDALALLRNVLVMAHNVISPVVGEDADLTPQELPTFQYL